MTRHPETPSSTPRDFTLSPCHLVTGSSSAAPANTRPRAPWPRWRKLLAYAAMALLALFSIWLVDRKVDLLESPASIDSHNEPRP
jgi:hypothetical protein